MESQSQEAFKRLKVTCVPLLGASLLSPKTIPNVSKLLGELITILRDIKTSGFHLTPSLISYTFFPISTILQRNAVSDIPDQVLEKLFISLAILCEDWWWDCDLAVWEQIFMLCGAIIGTVEVKGKRKDTDDETKEAACQCLFSLLHKRDESPPPQHLTIIDAETRLGQFQAHSGAPKFLPILGQTLNSILMIVESHHVPLQRICLELLSLFIGVYAPEDLIPTVLPGVVSCMTKVSLGSSRGKGWTNGEIVAGALNAMQLAIVKAVGDDVCIAEGALHHVVDLEDLGSTPELHDERSTDGTGPYSIGRSPSWLRGTSSQLLIALNTLTSLVSHPTPSALLSLSKFSSAILNSTSLTLPHTQPLLLSFLLSLSLSSYVSVSVEAQQSLEKLLTAPSKARHSLLQTLLHSTAENLSALPRLLPSHSDARIEHVAGLIEAACRLADTKEQLSSISTGIGKLLGPTGGIEKWGWNLLSVLKFVEPPIVVSQTSEAQLMLESDPETSQWVPFPEVAFENVFSRSARDALERMFRSLGRAGGDICLFSVEWFANIGQNGVGHRSVAATWCACRLMEGVAGISLLTGTSDQSIPSRRSNRLLKLARSLTKSTSELWDESSDAGPLDDTQSQEDDPNSLVQHIQGLSPIHEMLHIVPVSHLKVNPSIPQPTLHRALLLQLLAVSAGVLQARFSPMFIYALYPVLHSLVSNVAYLSSTALATLSFITNATSHASPANLLLSNFDYALDAVSRRLGRRWLDEDATKVLSLLVRLVGSDVVERAGDVVEECFDRLDEFHGYEVIVEGLVGVLGEVITVVQEGVAPSSEGSNSSAPHQYQKESVDTFLHWFSHRHEHPRDDIDTTDYGPAPRRAWGNNKVKGTEEDTDEETPQNDADADPPPTPIQALTLQIVTRSIYFLTHSSPLIRARILMLLSSSVPVLPESALLPSIHSGWPFILNRFGDSEFFVVSAAASLVESLTTHVGSFMFRRIWDDVWPRFLVLLEKLNAADSSNALSRRGYSAVGTESAYTHSHRLYKSLIKTMTAATKGVHPHSMSIWQVLLAFRRFLHIEAHDELQQLTRELYVTIGRFDADAVWLALSSTSEDHYVEMHFMNSPHWDIRSNVITIYTVLGIQ